MFCQSLTVLPKRIKRVDVTGYDNKTSCEILEQTENRRSIIEFTFLVCNPSLLSFSKRERKKEKEKRNKLRIIDKEKRKERHKKKERKNNEGESFSV